MLFHLVYVSSAVNPFNQEELVELLTKARENNARLGITGLLLYKDGNFMQVLEGEMTAVKALYEKISRDPRHEGTIVLLEDTIASRQFSNWSVGFRNLSDEAIQALPGYSQFMNKALVADNFRHDPTGCLALLNMFREGR